MISCPVFQSMILIKVQWADSKIAALSTEMKKYISIKDDAKYEKH